MPNEAAGRFFVFVFVFALAARAEAQWEVRSFGKANTFTQGVKLVSPTIDDLVCISHGPCPR